MLRFDFVGGTIPLQHRLSSCGCGNQSCQVCSFRRPVIRVNSCSSSIMNAHAYPLPIFIVNVALLQGMANLLLEFLRDLLISINGRVILFVTVTTATFFFHGVVDVGNQLWCDASPGNVSIYNRSCIHIQSSRNSLLLLCRRAHQCLHMKAWIRSLSTQVPMRSSPFWILTLASLHSLFWQPARPVEANSVIR